MFILSDPMFYVCMVTSVTVIYLRVGRVRTRQRR